MNDETYEENRPLLEEPGHHQLLETITPEEVQEAQKLLAPFVKEYKMAGVEKVAVLAYLFGVKQGRQEILYDTSRRNLAKDMIDANYAGKLHGFMEAVLLFGKVSIAPSILQRIELPKEKLEPEE